MGSYQQEATMASQDLTDGDRKMLRYMTYHVRFWSASALGPHFGLSAVQARDQLDALERAGYVRRVVEPADASDPSFTLTAIGIEAAVS
jgi:DNA-binding MarR family transcriptional regulator